VLTVFSGALDLLSDGPGEMRLYVQNRFFTLEAARILVLFLVFLSPVYPVMVVEIPASTPHSVSDDQRSRLDMGAPTGESNLALNDSISRPLSSSTSWELVEEEAIAELYVAHYKVNSYQSPVAWISAASHSGSRWMGEASGTTAVLGGASNGLCIGLQDRGEAWHDGVGEVVAKSDGNGNSAVLLSYYSIRQGYSNPDFAFKISVIAKVRGFSV